MKIAALLLMATVLLEGAGRLVISQRAEPRTFNPAIAVDAPTRDIMRLIHGRLVKIDGVTLGTRASLARSWKFSPGGRTCTIELRRGVRFSDGHPFDARDVVFTFAVYLDPKVASSQRDLLSPGGKPVRVTQLSSHTVRLDFAEPHAPAERLFDGLAILPRHKLEGAHQSGKLAQAWALGTPPADMAGLGPFSVEQHRPGQSLRLRRNPYYWESGKPRLDEVEVLFTADQTAEALRFRRGEIDLLQRPPAEVFDALPPGIVKLDAGSSLEYHFLFFNLNNAPGKVAPAVQAKQAWFRDPVFRRAISLAADRGGMSKLAFAGRAAPLSHHVTPGNKPWLAEPHAPRHSTEEAARLLAGAGFRLDSRTLRDASGRAVEFTVVVNAANNAQVRMAAILQEDLRAIGIAMRPVSIEFRALVDRVLKSLDYDAALMALGGGDADPNAEMNVWLSAGSMHVWNLSAENAPLAWEGELDRWMRRQQSVQSLRERKEAYANVQKIVTEQLPIIPLLSPHMLVAHKPGLKGVRPGLVPPHALWNIEDLVWEPAR